MKHKLTKTDNYLLVVDDSDIKVHDYYLRYSTKVLRCTDMKWVFNDALNKNEIIITSDSSGDPYDRSKHFLKKIISHLPLNGAPYLDGVDRLPPMDSGEEEDVKKLAEKVFPYPTDIKDRNDRIIQTYGVKPYNHAKIEKYRRIWVDGHNKSREKYEFTKEDMRKAIIMSSLSTVDFIPDRCDVIIQTIQQPKYPIAFECEVEPKFKHIGSTKEVKGSGSRIKNKYAGNPKTITNSEGRTEWVGKYIYE
jgi:hypothetical protein